MNRIMKIPYKIDEKNRQKNPLLRGDRQSSG